jgi:hypothetical protein
MTVRCSVLKFVRTRSALDKENFGVSKLMTSLYPDGMLAIIAPSFNAVAASKGKSNPSSLATRKTLE